MVSLKDIIIIYVKCLAIYTINCYLYEYFCKETKTHINAVRAYKKDASTVYTASYRSFVKL